MYGDIFTSSKRNNYYSNEYLEKQVKTFEKLPADDSRSKWKDLKKRSIATVLKYCEMTSLHGLRYLAEPGRPLYERIFWLLALALVYVGMVMTITAQVKNYLSNPVLMSLNGQITPVWDIPFPAITFCSENQIQPSTINFTELISKRNRSTVDNYKIFIGSKICPNYLKIITEQASVETNNVPVDDFVDAETYMKVEFMVAIPICRKMIKSLSWQQVQLADPCAYIQMMTTTVGFCFTFNMLPLNQLFSEQYVNDMKPKVFDELPLMQYKYFLSDRVWDVEKGYEEVGFGENAVPWRMPGMSYDNAVTFVLDFMTDDMAEECVQGGHGFWVAIHSPAEPPTPYQTLGYAETDTSTMLKVSPQLTSTSENLRMWTPESRGCFYSHERQLQFFNTYSVHNCDVECETNMTLRYCNCSLSHLPHELSTPICGLQQIQCVRNTIMRYSSRYQDSKVFSACNCLPACTELNYDMDTNNLPIWFDELDDNITKNVVKKGSLAVVTVLFKTNSVSSIERVAIVTLSDFVANIGGLMGLFLGFSFISLMEVIYFMTARWATDVWNHRRV